MRSTRILCGAVGATLGVSGCLADNSLLGGRAAADEAPGRSVAAVTVVPADVGCLRLELGGVASGVQSFAVPPGAMTRVDLGVLPPGELTVLARAYRGGCSADAPDGVGEELWRSDVTRVAVSAGRETNVPLVLRRVRSTELVVDFVERAAQVALSFRSTLVLFDDGTVHAWGSNAGDRLGVGEGVTFAAGQAVPGLTRIRQVSAGDSHFCALDADGAVWCWGANRQGQLGRGSFSPSAAPAPVSLLVPRRFVQVALSGLTSCARTEEGEVWCWGSNRAGALGLGASFRDTPAPLRVASLRAAVDLVPAAEGFAATDEGLRVRAWGSLVGLDGCSLAPAPSPGLPRDLATPRNLAAVAPGSGSRVCLLLADGTAQCCGQNQNGALGNGRVSHSGPFAPVADLTDAVGLHAWGNSPCAVRAGGSLVCWGSGTLGDGSAGDARPSPGAVRSVTDVAEAVAGTNHACARARDGRVWCWGDNESGQLGDGSRTPRFAPVPMRL